MTLFLILICEGYHGDDGMRFIEANQSTKFGPKFGQDDVIGAGVDIQSGELFFTKNGALIGKLLIIISINNSNNIMFIIDCY